MAHNGDTMASGLVFANDEPRHTLVGCLDSRENRFR